MSISFLQSSNIRLFCRFVKHGYVLLSIVTKIETSLDYKFVTKYNESNAHRSLTPAKAYRLQNGKEADANLKAKWEAEAKRKREQVAVFFNHTL